MVKHLKQSRGARVLFSAAILFGAIAPTPAALLFDGVNDYVSFGAAPGLGVTNFTIECWFRLQGAGDGTSTGTGGIANGVPLVAKGRAQADGDNRDMNFFLGLSGNVLAADFEDWSSGANHPVLGLHPVTSNTWQHAAVTYDQLSGRWVLYLNGVPDVTNTVSGTSAARTPRGDSIQHAALASALQSNGAADGFLAGALDEVRIWRVARTSEEIAASYNLRITNATGLIARWGLDQSSGGTASNSVPGGINGTLLNGPLWTTGHPFAGENRAPFAPAINSPANGAIGVSTSPTLSVTVSDPDTNNLTVTFHGRVASTPPPDFTLVLLPDTQHYVSSLDGGLPAMFVSQTDWILANRTNRNIQYVGHVGDCVENGDNDAEWRHVTNALYRLENPLTTSWSNGIPYGTAVGNHDQTPNGSASGSTALYNQYFGSAHFQNYGYYGGHFSTNNDNHYDLFSASGMDFIVIYFEYNTGATATNNPVFVWANGLLQTHHARRAIVVSHYILDEGFNAPFGAQGAAIYNALKGNTNLFLMLCGHQHDANGEGQRTNTFNGRTVWTVLSDYQDRVGGGNGLLRLYEFSPANNVIRVKTYSPWLGQFETDADSQFEIPYAMTAPAPFAVIGAYTGVASGAITSMAWPGRLPNTAYEYYVTVSDGSLAVSGPIWNFTTGDLVTNPPPAVQIVGVTLAGADLVLEATNVIAGRAYEVLTSTNLLLPLNQWEPIATLVPAGSGSLALTLTNAASSLDQQRFFLLQSPTD